MFFLITIWRLAEKFSSLNPDLDNLHKIKWEMLLNSHYPSKFGLIMILLMFLNDISYALLLLVFVRVCYEQIFISIYRAFTVTAVAQLCILGIMWVFGCFQFDENTLVMSYIFTILSSLQGVLMFIMHCWLSKQVSSVRLITRMQSLDKNV